LHDPAAMFADSWVDHLASQRLERRERAAFITAHEAGVARHVGRYDCRQSSLLAPHILSSFRPAARNAWCRRSASAGALYGIIASTSVQSISDLSRSASARVARASSVRPMAASTPARAM